MSLLLTPVLQLPHSSRYAFGAQKAFCPRRPLEHKWRIHLSALHKHTLGECCELFSVVRVTRLFKTVDSVAFTVSRALSHSSTSCLTACVEGCERHKFLTSRNESKHLWLSLVYKENIVYQPRITAVMTLHDNKLLSEQILLVFSSILHILQTCKCMYSMCIDADTNQI